jgi:hypothetical protein
VLSGDATIGVEDLLQGRWALLRRGRRSLAVVAVVRSAETSV